jgi:hypothetical protein
MNDTTRKTVEKRVAFREQAQIVNIVDDSKADYQQRVELWYSDEELKESRKQVKLSALAVNDACGDFDAQDDAVETFQKVILSKQAENAPAELARISQELSASSAELARLYAKVLEKDVEDTNAVTYEILLDIVNDVFLSADCDNDLPAEDDDMESIGTIDELPLCFGDHTFLDLEDRVSEISKSDNLVRQKLHQPKTDCILGGSLIETEKDLRSKGLCSELAQKDCKIETSLGKKRGLSPLPQVVPREESKTMGSNDTCLFETSDRRVKRRVSYEQETSNRCSVAHALISLARWEFRGHKYGDGKF